MSLFCSLLVATALTLAPSLPIGRFHAYRSNQENYMVSLRQDKVRASQRSIPAVEESAWEGLVVQEVLQECTRYVVYAAPDGEICQLIPAYLPAELTLTEERLFDTQPFSHYYGLYQGEDANGNELHLMLRASLAQNAAVALDTEDALVETIDLLGAEAVLIRKQGRTHLNWVSKGVLYSLISNIAYEEAICIATSLRSP